MGKQTIVAAELIKDLNAEIQGLRAELSKARIENHRVERKLQKAVGQLRLMHQDRDFSLLPPE
jgi:chromosome segregation ATPase